MLPTVLREMLINRERTWKPETVRCLASTVVQYATESPMKVRGARRFREQKWLLDSVVSTIGLDWDLLRMATVTAPIGFEGMGDWAVVASKAKRFDDISPSFEEVAAGREARAHEAAQQGNEITARESYLVASIYYGVAQWPIDEINDRNLELNAKKLDCYTRYAVRAHHKIERVKIPMGKHIVPAWLHLPVTGRPPYPLVIMLPGMDTFKEKLVWGYGDKMLERGFAALAIDGPGQSEPLMHGLWVTADNFADAGRACIAWIDTRKDLDQNRIGVFGRSFGSYAATVLSNAIADRLRGVVVGLPCFEPGFNKIFEEASPTYKNRFMFMAGYEDEAEFDKFIQGFDLRTRVFNLGCPFMVLGGELDELSPIKHVFEVCKKVPGPVEIVVYQNERHAPGRLPSSQLGPHWYAVMADWLTARVRDRLPIEGSHYRYVTASGKVEQRPML
jgi:pimeloyl-ACP methyl ester carboxylesterase